MNYLQLCQRTAQECGVATGSAITAALPTVTGATGSLARVCTWVADAWADIWMDRDDWDFLRSSVLLGGGATFATVAGQVSYPLGTGVGTVGIAEDSFANWDRWTFRCYPTAVGVAGEVDLDAIDFDQWRDTYMMGAQRLVQTRPTVVAIGPNKSLNLGPPPNGLYTITADYYATGNDLTVDTDVPIGLPSRFHTLIVLRAMMKYGGYEAAPEVYQRGSEENAPMYSQLLATCAPRARFSGALA